MKISLFCCAVGACLSVLASHANANLCDGPVDDLLDSFNSGDYSKTVEIATEMMADSKSTQCASLFVTRGRAYLLLGQTDAAVRDLETGARLNPTSCMTSLFLAIGYRKQGRIDIPDDGLLACIEREPANIGARYTLASVYIANVDYDAAADTFGAIVAVAPEELFARISQANALRRATRYAEAKRTLQEVLSDHPNSSFAHEEMGQWYFSQGENRESISWFNTSIDLGIAAEDNPEILADMFNSRAMAWLEVGDVENASDDVDESLALFENASAFLTRAKLALRNGSPVEVCPNLHKAVELDPGKEEQIEIDGLLPNCR